MGLYPAFAIQIRGVNLKLISSQRETISGTHKNLRSPCNIAQSIQLSNIVLADFHQLPACAGMGLACSRVVQTPELLQPNVRRQIHWHPTSD